MSICDFGMDCKVVAQNLVIKIDQNHPLMLLGAIFPWQLILDIVVEDLKQTSKGQWFRGRKLKARIHLGVYVLQQLYDPLIDRLSTQSVTMLLFSCFAAEHSWTSGTYRIIRRSRPFDLV